jgi:hypothetical protein
VSTGVASYEIPVSNEETTVVLGQGWTHGLTIHIVST